jgi:hypothetical protein
VKSPPDTTPPKPPTPAEKAKAERAARLAAALRTNLRRRKAPPSAPASDAD